METRGARIFRLRTALGMNQAALAKAANVDQSTVSDWESKNAAPKADQLVELAKALGESVEYVLQGTNRYVWPFPKIPLERFEHLDPDDRGYVQRKLLQAIEECEGSKPSGAPRLVPSSTESKISHPPELGVDTKGRGKNDRRLTKPGAGNAKRG